MRDYLSTSGLRDEYDDFTITTMTANPYGLLPDESGPLPDEKWLTIERAYVCVVFMVGAIRIRSYDPGTSACKTAPTHIWLPAMRGT